MLLSFLLPSSRALRPRFSWDTLGNMSFFHACNESGLFSSEALDTITKFPFVTIEKGQGFNDGSAPCTASGGSCAEDKIIAQIGAIKSRDPTISTVFYMNSVLDWYFYRMHYQFLQHPDWWLRCSQGPDEASRGRKHSGQPITTGGARPTRDQAKGCTAAGAPFYTSGDRHFNPPEEGMLVFDDSKPAVRDFWLGVCFRAVATGVVDGCFSDSSEVRAALVPAPPPATMAVVKVGTERGGGAMFSQVGSHKTGAALNRSTNASYEAGKVTTMAQATAHFGGTAGTPYPPGANGTLIGKFPNQVRGGPRAAGRCASVSFWLGPWFLSIVSGLVDDIEGTDPRAGWAISWASTHCRLRCSPTASRSCWC